jgi:hypothetical protein
MIRVFGYLKIADPTTALFSQPKLTTDAFTSIQRLTGPINDWQRIQQDDFSGFLIAFQTFFL